MIFKSLGTMHVDVLAHAFIIGRDGFGTVKLVSPWYKQMFKVEMQVSDCDFL